MTTITLHSHVGEDGLLKLLVPLEIKDTDLEVVLVVHPLRSTSSKNPENLGWRPEFFERIAGGWQGEKFVRETQGEYPIREELG